MPSLMTKDPNLLKDIQKIELNPSKSYILFLPAPAPLDAKQLETIERLYDALKKRGIDNMIVTIDNPQDIRVIEAPKP